MYYIGKRKHSLPPDSALLLTISILFDGLALLALAAGGCLYPKFVDLVFKLCPHCDKGLNHQIMLIQNASKRSSIEH